MKKVILLCGQKQAGKDTFAAALRSRDVVRVAHADALRELLFDVVMGVLDVGPHSLSGEQKERARPLFQAVGQAVRAFSPDYWAAIACADADLILVHHAAVVVTDLRFPNELAFWRRRFPNAKLVCIQRPGLPDDDPDESEHAWRGLPFDEVIVNDGTLEDFRQKALDFAKREGLLYDPA